MDIATAHIVEATAGRDCGRFFFVLETQGDHLLLADGKGRRVEAPKRKSRKHVRVVGTAPAELAARLIRKEKVTNSELRKAIAVFGENQRRKHSFQP